MRNRLLAVGLVGWVAFAACGGDGDRNPVEGGGANTAGKFAGISGKTGSGGEGGSETGEGGGGNVAKPFGGTAGKSGGGGNTAMGGNDEGGAGGAGGDMTGTPPTVTVLSPEEVTDPLGGKVILASNVTVLCKVTEGEGPDASPLDPTSVVIAVLDSDGSVVVEEVASPTANDDEYSAELSLDATESGKISFRCSAESTTNALGTDERLSLVDHGPNVALKSPLNDGNLALVGQTKFTFEVTPAPLAATDPQADVESYELRIAGKLINNVLPVANMAGTYEAVVDLNSATFNPKPDGNTPVVIKATNKRSPTAVTATGTYNVSVDGKGPTISVTSPPTKDLVGRDVPLKFTVTDTGSGVDPSTVSVTINDEKHVYSANDANWSPPNGNAYSYLFDSRTLDNAKVQITINFDAQDNVKNAAATQAITLFIDNVAPEVDMDPTNVRTVSAQNECSGSFDPLGDLAVNDRGHGVTQDFLRVLVWERTNEGSGGGILHYAGTDTTTVRVHFAVPSPNYALLVSKKTPGSGICDDLADVNPKLQMTGLVATGNPYFLVNGGQSPATNGCTLKAQAKPGLLCNAESEMWQVIDNDDGTLNNDPAVFAQAPTAGDECTGIPWEYSAYVSQDGWVCFAAKAVDKVGNIGISPPIRLCVDKNPGDQVKPACWDNPANPPSCTDGCTAPARGGGHIVPF